MPGRGPQHSGECGARAENRLRFEEARAAPSCCNARRTRQECRACLILPNTYAIMCRARLVGTPARLVSTRLTSSDGDHHRSCFRNCHASCCPTPMKALPRSLIPLRPTRSSLVLPGGPGLLRPVSAGRRLYDDSKSSRLHDLDSAPQGPGVRNSNTWTY